MSGDGLLGVPLGGVGSARQRYGVAMGLYQAGALSPEQVAAYRVAAGNDAAAPADLLRERGLQVPDMAVQSPAALLWQLLVESDRYLATLPGPGIAEVRQGLALARGQMARPAPPGRNDVVATCLPAALTALTPTHPALATAIEAAAPHLHWVTYDAYPPDRIGPDFGRSHAFASLIGATGNFVADDFDFGLFLIAPHVLYRDHRHRAPELYAPLTGPHGWRFAPNAPLHLKPAHQPVWNLPLQPHATKVGPLPFLALFCWTGDTGFDAEVLAADDWPELEALRLDG